MGVQLYRDPGQSLPPGPSSPGAPASARRNTPPPRTPPRPDGSPQLPTSINPITKSALPFSIENILRPDFGSLSPNKPAFLPYKPHPAFFQYSSPFTVFSNCITPLPHSPSPASLRPVDLSSTRITSANLSSLRKPTASIGGLRKPSVDLISPRKHSGDHGSLRKPSEDLTAGGIKKPSANILRKPSSDGDKKLAVSDAPIDPEALANPPLPAEDKMVWPAWVYCTRYSDRPSSGPRSRRTSKPKKVDEKRPRTAFSSEQLDRLTQEFNDNKYLSEDRRQRLSRELGLNESQIKIWFQNKRAKLKKTSSGQKPTLAMKLMEQGLYNHTTIAAEEEERLLRLCQSQAM